MKLKNLQRFKISLQNHIKRLNDMTRHTQDLLDTISGMETGEVCPECGSGSYRILKATGGHKCRNCGYDNELTKKLNYIKNLAAECKKKKK